MKSNISSLVIIWLIVGLVLIYFQIVIGGITRLTGSGLSITKWEIVTGTLPPLNQVQWEEAFSLYKNTPQYKKINEGMSMHTFKIIYFWEYFHRLWARSMGFVFIIPFAIFLFRKKLPATLIRRLIILVVLAAIVGLFGWIMVASGLINRPWVNAYKLTVHLSLALIVFAYLWWTILLCWYPDWRPVENRKMIRYVKIMLVLICMQIIFGGLMSGMRAALTYPTFPNFHGEFFPDILLQKENWVVDNFVNYDQSGFASALVQVLHRYTAYAMIIIGLYGFFNNIKSFQKAKIVHGGWLLVTMLVIQSGLGIYVLINSKGYIPVYSGVIHQALAILVLMIAIYTYYFSKTRIRVF
jgi:cytochrome c oxidase assembly protein subunit 15